MKKLTVMLIVILPITFLKAQQLDKIDVMVAQYPKTFDAAEELAALINNDFETETDKARAVYSWIAMNVEFDTKAYFARKKKNKRLKYKDAIDRANKIRNREIKLENRALSEHKAVAEGYTQLYKRVCELTGVYGYIIKGTAKLKTTDIGIRPKMLNHSWNVVQVGKDWFLVDVTLGAGTVDYDEKAYRHSFNEEYFFTPPEKFFLNHFPKDPGWSLTEKTMDDFANLPLFSGEYLRNDFELFEPLNGILDLKGQDSVRFRINSPAPVSSLYYQYSFDEEPTEIQLERENEEYTFSIPFNAKRRGYLSLYYNKEPIISYKIAY